MIGLCLRMFKGSFCVWGCSKDRFVSEDVQGIVFVSDDVQRIVLCLRMFKGSFCV